MELNRPGWRKASHSTSNGQCVEVAGVGTAVAVRDSKDPDGPRLEFAPKAWAGFCAGVKHGEFATEPAYFGHSGRPAD